MGDSELVEVVSATDLKLEDCNLSRLPGVIINNSKAKNDTAGEGHRFHCVRQKKISKYSF